jgi:hypothetical protein
VDQPEHQHRLNAAPDDQAHYQIAAQIVVVR